MRDLYCPHCGQRLTFENSQCLRCNSIIGYDLAARTFVRLWVVDPGELDVVRYPCANRERCGCTWAVPADGDLCTSCALTRTRPSDSELASSEATRTGWAQAEAAKRRLVHELSELGLPIVGKREDPEGGLAFDLLSSADQKVVTGHADGVITLDLAESDDVHREQLRISMDEPYRTLLGHFRHEVGHYYFMVLVDTDECRVRFEKEFGDPDADYQEALDRHYSEGAPAGWEDEYISAYATMHPAEDWAETFAHYLHIRGTIDTAAANGFAPAGATLTEHLVGPVGFERLVDIWLPLSWSLNMVNRSMGHADLYPFVLPERVLEKMLLVHDLVVARVLAST